MLMWFCGSVVPYIMILCYAAPYIMMLCYAAGGAIDPFWALYQQHMVENVMDILKQYRVWIYATTTHSFIIIDR